MTLIESSIDLIVRNTYVLYYNSSSKTSNEEIYDTLDRGYDKLTNLVVNSESENIHIANYIGAIENFIKSTTVELGFGESERKVNAIEYLRLTMKVDRRFNYYAWGRMHKKVQNNYLRVYQYYSKALYELSKPMLK